MNVLKKPLQLSDLKRYQEMWPKDWTLRFISLALAVLLWHFVGGNDTVNKSVMVPVEVINLPRDLVISNQFKREIEVTLSGPRNQVLGIEKGDLRRQVDLAKAVPGTMVINNENQMISVPRGVKVQRIQPDSIILSLDKLIQKQLVVKPVTKGNVASHFVLKDIKMKPETISITGPQAVLSQLDGLQTEPLDISGMNQSVQLQIPLELNPALLELIGETSVTADLVIVEESVEKRISGLPIEMNGMEGMQVTPSSVTVTAVLPRSLVKDNKDLHPLFKVILVDEKEPGQMSVRVVLRDNHASPVQILKIEPQVVSVEKGKQDAPSRAKE